MNCVFSVLCGCVVLTDLGPALLGSDSGLERAHVPGLCGAHPVPGADAAADGAPLPHGGAPVPGPLPGGPHHHRGSRAAG